MANHVQFATWLENYGVKKIAKELSITKAAVYAWMRGDAAPKTTTLQKIVKLGKGKLSYDSIISESTRNVAKWSRRKPAKSKVKSKAKSKIKLKPKAKVISIKKPVAKKPAKGVKGAAAKPALKAAATKKKPAAKAAPKSAPKKKSSPSKKAKKKVDGATAVDTGAGVTAANVSSDKDPAFDI